MAANVLLIVGGDYAGHPFHRTIPSIYNVLIAGGYKPHIDTNLVRIKERKLDEYDAIVLQGHFPWTDEWAQGALLELERYVHSGRGLVVVHTASASFVRLLNWQKLVGRVWEYGISDHPPKGPFQVNITDSTHPITATLRDFELEEDERYHDLIVAPDAEIHDLAFATLGGRKEPIAWVLTSPQRGRVFHMTLGHDKSTFENIAFQTFFNHGVAWAAGELK